MILYTREDAFNGWYWIGDVIEDIFDSMTLPMIWLVTCGWIFNNVNVHCGIDDTDTPTEKVYQIM